MNMELLDQFFKENSIEDDLPSAPALAHFSIILARNPELNAVFQETVNESILKSQPEREEKVLAEKSEIESVTNYEQIIQLMRGKIDSVNQFVLIDKAIEFEDEVVPEIVRRLKTSLNNNFIETSIRILAKSEKDFVEELIEYFDDMRLPYAQAMVLVLLGFKADEAIIPWLIEKYKEMKKWYPDKRYCEGAYYALSEIETRFRLTEVSSDDA